MLHLMDTRFTHTRHADVLPGHVIPEEGAALVYVKANGQTCVRMSTGAAGEIFAGVSFERYNVPRTLVFIREYVLDESGVLRLPREPIAGQIAVIEDGVVSIPVAGTTAPTDDSSVIDGSTLLFQADPATAGRVVRVQFLYSPTLEEARSIQGDRPFGERASELEGVIGRILNGVLATSFVDITKDWTNVLEVGLGADGRFVPATANNKVPNVVVMNTPDGAGNFLKIAINVE